MTNQLAIRDSAADFDVMLRQAQILVKTGFLPKAIDTPEKAVAIILTGRELGIGTMQALRSIDVINGKPTVSPQLMLALINQSGQLENLSIQQDDAGVTCAMKRKNRDAHSEYFGFVEAKQLGLDGKDNYRKQPFTMFRWRAVASCARVVFPDVILGLYTPDEMGVETAAEDEAPNGIPVEIVPFEPKITVKLPPAELPAETAQSVQPSQRIDENQELNGEIWRLLNVLGKNENDFNNWFQKKYDFDLHWERAGVAVKREVVGILKNWQAKAQQQAA